MAATAYPISHDRRPRPVRLAPRSSPTRPVSPRRTLRVAPGTYARRRAAAVALLAVLALFCALAIQVVLGAVGGGPLTAPAPSGPQPVASRTYVVQPGDTLWSIARELQPEGDVRAAVHVLKEQLGSSVLQPGDRITIPPG